MKYFAQYFFAILVLAILIYTIGIGYAKWHFFSKANVQAEWILAQNNGKKTIVKSEMLDDLPANVQKWLKHSGVVGKEWIQNAGLRQKGILRTSAAGKWMHVEAVQYFTTDKPAFIWIANIKGGALMHISGKDVYRDGKGSMIIKVLSLFTVADAAGKEIDQGTLVRYLAEMQWFPSAALSTYIKWESITVHSARATMKVGDVTASGIFAFNDNGDITGFEAKRYMEHNGKYSLETWSVPITGYKEFNGVRIPAKGKAIWKLKTGDFEWFEWEVTDIAYNISSPYHVPW